MEYPSSSSRRFSPIRTDFTFDSGDTGGNEDSEQRLRKCCDKARNDKAAQLNLRSEVLRSILSRPDMADHKLATKIALVGVRKQQLELERERKA